MAVLCRYYDQLNGELVKLFKECPKAAKCCLGGEYVYSRRDWSAGKYWRVTLSESIRYTDGIVIAQEKNKQKDNKLGPFLLEKNSFILSLKKKMLIFNKRVIIV